MLRRFAFGVLGLNVAVILWGAFVRATGSGAGCGSHWPTCNGEVIPRAESVETAIEFTHRLTSGLAFLAVLALLVAALYARPKGHPMRGAAIAAFAFMVLEAALGAGLVLFGLVADDRSPARAWVMGAHLVNTFLLLAASALSAWWAAPDAERVRVREHASLAWAIGIALAGVALVGVSGAVTALGDTLFPAESLEAGLREDLAADAHFLVRLRVWHPALAVVVGLYTVGVGAISAMLRGEPRIRRAAMVLALLFLLQLGGGFLNLLLLAPTWMQIVHLFMADAVWIALVILGAEVLDAPGTTRAKVSGGGAP